MPSGENIGSGNRHHIPLKTVTQASDQAGECGECLQEVRRCMGQSTPRLFVTSIHPQDRCNEHKRIFCFVKIYHESLDIRDWEWAS